MHGPSPAPAPGGRFPPWVLVWGLIGGVLAIAAIIVAREVPPKFAVTAIGGVLFVAMLLMIRNMRLFCLYMVILMAPLGLRQSFMEFPHLGGASAVFLEVVDPFLLLLLYFQVRERFRGYRPGYRYPRALGLWTGMIVMGVGSVLFMEYLRVTAFNETFRMLKLLLLALLIVNEVQTTRQFKHVIVAIFLGVILQSSVGLLEYVRGGQLGLTFLGEATDEDIRTLSDATFERARLSGQLAYRVSGLLGHANLLACYLALFLPLAVALILTAVSTRLKLLLAIALLLGMPALVLTLSRAGWIDYVVAFAIVLAFGAVNSVSRHRYRSMRVIIVTITVVVAVAMSPQIIRRLYETDPSAVQYRIKWLETSKAMIVDHPVWGTGLNTYVFAQLPYGEHKTPEAMSNHYGRFWPAVHNTWALTWSEQGTVGFVLFVWMHLSVILVALRNLKIRDPMMHALNVGLLGGFVAVMVDGMASFFIRVEAPARMFWIATALILAIGYWRRANEEKVAPLPERLTPMDGAADDRAASGRWLPHRPSVLR